MVRFAICGDDTGPIKIGAQRNAILLYSAGKKILFTDDDVICSLHSIPGADPSLDIKKLFLTSFSLRRSWFFDDYESATAYFPKIEMNYLEAHEAMLGKMASQIIGNLPNRNNATFDKEPGGVSDALIKKIGGVVSPNIKISTTHSGMVGDTFMRVHTPIMVSLSDTEYSLWGHSKEEYIKNRNTSVIAKAFDQYSLYNGPVCIGYTLGVDARDLIPPFSPLHRAEDGIFGHLLHIGFPHAVSGYIPLLVEHKRAIGRIPLSDTVKAFSTIARLTMIAMGNAQPIQLDPEITLRDIGQKLIDMSAIQPKEFKKIMLNECLQLFSAFAKHSRVFKEYYKNAPAYWQEDMDQMIEGVEAVANGNLPIPIFWDVDGWDASDEKTWIMFGKWLEKYGNVLVHWPAMFQFRVAHQ